MESKKKTKICPRCSGPATFEGNPYRPFCSRRCKLADLGSWLKEEYCISSSIFPMDGYEPFEKSEKNGEKG